MLGPDEQSAQDLSGVLSIDGLEPEAPIHGEAALCRYDSAMPGPMPLLPELAVAGTRCDPRHDLSDRDRQRPGKESEAVAVWCGATDPKSEVPGRRASEGIHGGEQLEDAAINVCVERDERILRPNLAEGFTGQSGEVCLEAAQMVSSEQHLAG